MSITQPCAPISLQSELDEIDDEIAATQAIIVRDQRWEKRVTTRYDVVDIKDNFAVEVTKDIADAEVDLGEVAAGVTVVDIDLRAKQSFIVYLQLCATTK